MSLKKNKSKAFSWIKIARLQFYPMPWIVYSLGAAAAFHFYKKFSLSVYLLGYSFLFCTELCSVLVNEYYDFKTDKLNENNGPFNGGSRILVEGGLSLKSVKFAILFLLALILILGFVLTLNSQPDQVILVSSLLLFGLVFGLGYTAPPLKFSYRGLGEIVVAVIFSTYLILCGFVFHGGAWKDPFPWLISLPLLFAVLAAIILSGIPDISADRSANKKTLAVIFGPFRTTILSAVSVSFAAIAWIWVYQLGILP